MQLIHQWNQSSKLKIKKKKTKKEKRCAEQPTTLNGGAALRWRWWTDNNAAVARTGVVVKSLNLLPRRPSIGFLFGPSWSQSYKQCSFATSSCTVPASRQWDTPREEIFFPNRQFTVKLLGEAWRILRGVQQVVGCNKLLPATSGFPTRAARASFVPSSFSTSTFSRREILRFTAFHLSLATNSSPWRRKHGRKIRDPVVEFQAMAEGRKELIIERR